MACTNQLSTGAAFVDVNGDARLDLLVTSCGGPNACFINIGSGRFTNVTEQCGLASKFGSTTMAFGDVDADGDLDMFVANYGENTIRSGMVLSTRKVNGRDMVVGRHANRLKIINGKMIELGEPAFFGLNDGDGKFAPVQINAFTDHAGAPLRNSSWDLGLCAVFRDLNGDLRPDLYVCNDFSTPDRIWMNEGQVRFRPLSHGALPISSQFSMSMDSADINRDGFVDFFVADMKRRSHSDMLRVIEADPVIPIEEEWETRLQRRQNILALNRGDGSFAEIALLAGVDASDWTWSAIFMDVDLDGYEDLLIGNGHPFDAEDQDTVSRNSSLKQTRAQTKTNLLSFPRLNPPNIAFRNNQDLTFKDVSSEWGFDSKKVSHGMCLADLDNDGDQDVIANAWESPPLLYRNNSSAPRIAVRLKGRGKNTAGIGAKIDLKTATFTQSQEMISGGRYLSSDDPLRVFAALEGAMTLKVTWPNGKRSTVDSIKPNMLIEVAEPEGPVAAIHPSPPPSPMFKEVKSDERFKVEKPNSSKAHDLARAHVGEFKDAALAHVDSDETLDFVVVSSWAPPRVFLQKDGSFAEATKQFGLDRFSGLWNRIAIADFDGDGRQDFVASNLGRNHRWNRHSSKPVRLYSVMDAEFEAVFEPTLNRYLPTLSRAQLGALLPAVTQRFPTTETYAHAGMKEVLGDLAANAAIREAAWFDSTIFFNRGDRFEPGALPIEAQFAPAFGIAVADFNGDNADDLFLTQNDSNVPPEFFPMNNGRGLVLLGDGKGKFSPAATAVAGISIPADQRACTAKDFDGDGKVDLAIELAEGRTRFFTNQRARK